MRVKTIRAPAGYCKIDMDHSIEWKRRDSLPILAQGEPMDAREYGRAPGVSPISWSTIIPASRRQDSIEGILMGCAVAEALSVLYSKLNPKSARAMTRNAIRVWTPMAALPGSRTHSIVMTIQAILQSKACVDEFGDALRTRMAWYRASRPLMRFRSRGLQAGTMSGENEFGSILGNDSMVRAALLSVVLQGHNSSALRWVQRSTMLSHENTLVSHAAMLVAITTQCAQLTRTASAVDPNDLLRLLSDATPQEALKQRLGRLDGHLKKRDSLHRAARALGYRRGLTDHVVDQALLAIYAYCIHHESYRDCIEAIVKLPGNTVGVAALAGAMVGAENGVQDIPKEWRERVSMAPYDDAWIGQYVERVQDWPHGPEDIQRTTLLPSRYAGQMVRNAWQTLTTAQLEVCRRLYRFRWVRPTDRSTLSRATSN